MTSNAEFFFGLVRISMLQLLKAHGFDKCKPSTVNTVTDLYIRFLELFMNEITKMADSRQDEDDTVALQDITLAMQNLGIIKPVDMLDVYDENPELPSDLGLQKFKEWCLYNFHRKDEVQVSLPTTDLLYTENKSTKPLSLIPEYINQIQNKNGEGKSNEEDQLLEELVNNGDFDNWIKFVAIKQRVNMYKKNSKNLPQSLESLPHIPGLKYTFLERNNASLNFPNNDLIPSVPLDEESMENDDNTPEYIKKGSKLLNKLPIMMHETRLDNIVLSFENEIYDDENIEPQNDDNEIKPMDISNEDAIEDDIEDNRINFMEVPESTVGSFSLDANMNTQFAEMEDMDNTFQRRDSLDFHDRPHF
ncbi:hypothetical protein Kpol_1058p38 [Vanderwaltozyma polyspora DSM 70294]|uniref:Bromodomain associated domain-containing protein n=1 Tax=Vanderwaltozyma polyspora (strain ATCC 22028 / DSM 70294 / BCRC 21397 / CBS 2163 / NBRC 10782 / NRRL Y-8283 / UCD 57-17) TaxID=436907 RepID=A7TJS2_VANPO|nr:uncharacterized protein Kpol_1058p38 [Vanderwaltozyma polyspora DSM 70294]EDO17501.1 hypothetical protein Kpol_1058p38 [Vanderwaltozyma polyspora DSM 70294]